MYNISFDIDYMNLYRIKHKLPPEDKIDPIITKGLERACNLLSNNNIKATFFIVGDSVVEYKSNYIKLIKEGMEIGNHTQNHTNLFDLSFNEQETQISMCQDIIAKELNYKSVGFKAPGCNYTERLDKILIKYGIKYNASAFNNILMPVAKYILYKQTGQNIFGSFGQILQTSKINIKNGLINIPYGTTSFKLPYYGSFHAKFPITAKMKVPKSPFTYLIHPIEFLENNEIDDQIIVYNTTLTERIALYKYIIESFIKNNREHFLLCDLNIVGNAVTYKNNKI